MRKKYFIEERRQRRNESNKHWRETHKKQKTEYDKQWRKEHPEYIKQWRKEHTEYTKQWRKEYYQKSKSKVGWIDEQKYRSKSYREKNKEKIANYMKLRAQNNINFRLAKNLRVRLCVAIRDNQKEGSAVSDLGCSIPELKTHLESKFQEGMTWDNWSRTGWHIDHIIPLSHFDLSNREEFLKACHYSNLQPMWAKENVSKKNKIIGV